MGLTKTAGYTDKETLQARYAKALAHPARIMILQLLINRQSCMCGNIVDELPIAQSTVSQHLNELKEAGLIKGSINGVKVSYCINEEAWEEAKLMLSNFFNQEINKNECC